MAKRYRIAFDIESDTEPEPRLIQSGLHLHGYVLANGMSISEVSADGAIAPSAPYVADARCAECGEPIDDCECALEDDMRDDDEEGTVGLSFARPADAPDDGEDDGTGDEPPTWNHVLIAGEPQGATWTAAWPPPRGLAAVGVEVFEERTSLFCYVAIYVRYEGDYLIPYRCFRDDWLGGPAVIAAVSAQYGPITDHREKKPG